MPPPAALDHLLAHEQFVRGILRDLLRDESRVDDTMQDVWLRTLQHRGHPPDEPRTWLARIARNLAISNWRSESRRRRRELLRDIGRPDASADGSQQRLELRQHVVAAILALEEPYRSVVLLRYEQHLPVAAIAASLRRSAATVRSQLSRAHDLLRQRLDRDYGGRERWAVMATGLLRSAPAVAVPFGVVAIGGGLLALVVAWTAWLYTTATPVALPLAPSPSPAPAIATVAAAGPVRAGGGEPEPDRVAPGAAAPAFLFLPRGELCDRAWFDDYERATFSFLYGTRDDPDLRLTHNDWDLEFSSGRFRCSTVTDDHSVLADLGPVPPASFGELAIGDVAFGDRLPVVADHTYVVLTRDSDTELATVVFVRRLVPGRHVTFDWFTTDGTPNAQGSLADPGNGRPWTRVLRELHEAHHRGPPPPSPVVLQLRGGAGGGNPNRIDFAGRCNAYVRERSPTPLDVYGTPDSRERIRGFASTGHVPPGQRFVVTDVQFRGGAKGDSNGPGAFRVCVAGVMLADRDTRAEPIDGAWRGELQVEHGAESDTWFETRNSSWGEVRLFGYLEPSPADPERGFAAANLGFRSGARPVADPTPPLAAPTVVLQAKPGRRRRSASVDLRGRVDERIGALQTAPIDLAAREVPDDCLAFATGGLVPADCVFVVTSATLRGSVGDMPPPIGGLRLVLGGETLLHAQVPGPYEATWTGRVEIPAGEETRTRLLVGDGCIGEVELHGALLPR